ncbi:hypothetical protein [Acetobacter cerevisiae]|uniref:hypothetical protein n=1 Tax=Acetobacter cerevisiae TaxID=178900 RepID=UPI0020A21AAA|nr:hypothetical protein [Acetobacter cerevisiae]MCP1271996.1 hypothetical protein [Acetobacter cerevisiae]MCP1279940.1 hypothetical protein [Acetobacter cerevisiae]
MPESNTITRPEFRAYQVDVDGQFEGVRKGISDLKEMVRKLATTRAVVNGGLTILGSALGSGIVTALHGLAH